MANSSPPRPRPQRDSPAAGFRRQAFPMSDPLEAPDTPVGHHGTAAAAAAAADSRLLSDFLQESRNSPEAHRRQYAHAQREHQRVLDQALHVFELHQLAEEARRIEEEETRRAARVAEEARRLEAERQAKLRQAEDEARLAAQKQRMEEEARAAAEAVQRAAEKERAEREKAERAQAEKAAAQKAAQAAQATAPAVQLPPQQPQRGEAPKEEEKQPQRTALFGQASTQPAQPAQPAQQAQQQQAPPAPNGTAQAAAAPPAPPTPTPDTDRHLQVHQNLKLLRRFVAEQGRADSALKNRIGDMRRDIRKSFGQLTSGGLKENRVPVNRIVQTLQAGLRGDVPSAPVDPGQFVLEPRPAAVDGALHNEPQLPSLYLYLLNILAKAAIAQFINESGADPRTADAIGQAVVKVYSEPEFFWRGRPMIDMLVAKFRVVCPVLFGYSGNDRTERGRLAVGWRREDGTRWIAEQYHIDRMTGLGAGFAAITLRDFSRVSRASPWPPTVYWAALARIVNTPAAAMSETQCYVLKAMIADNEGKFLGFYGHAGVAALRSALVDYPARMPKATAASETLKVLARTIKVRTGLDLEAI